MASIMSVLQERDDLLVDSQYISVDQVIVMYNVHDVSVYHER